jgi:hypothetical protein
MIAMIVRPNRTIITITPYRVIVMIVMVDSESGIAKDVSRRDELGQVD